MKAMETDESYDLSLNKCKVTQNSASRFKRIRGVPGRPIQEGL